MISKKELSSFIKTRGRLDEVRKELALLEAAWEERRRSIQERLLAAADGTLRYFVLPDTTMGAMAEQTVIDQRRSLVLPDGLCSGRVDFGIGGSFRQVPSLAKITWCSSYV